MENAEMTTNKGPLNEVSIECMLRNNEEMKPKYVVITRAKKGKAKIETTDEDISHDNEAWLKMLEIDDKIVVVTSTI
ncbi:hypothetical protein V6N12_076447 [Hibiscus sabdariffa]